MHLRAKPPIFVPAEYRAEIEKLSKAALMDLVWDYAHQDNGNDEPGEIMDVLRYRIDIIQIHRKD